MLICIRTDYNSGFIGTKVCWKYNNRFAEPMKLYNSANKGIDIKHSTKIGNI